MTDTATIGVVDRIVERIVTAIRPERIYLFGSQARGTATDDSDLDLYIVANMDGSPVERSRRIHRLFPRRHFSLDVFVFPPEEFERQKTIANSIGYIVHQEGRLLYERT